MNEPKTWADLLAIDETLGDVDAQIEFYRTRINDGNRWRVYERMKTSIWERVGWFATNADPSLQTSDAYMIAIHHICDTLRI